MIASRLTSAVQGSGELLRARGGCRLLDRGFPEQADRGEEVLRQGLVSEDLSRRRGQDLDLRGPPPGQLDARQVERGEAGIEPEPSVCERGPGFGRSARRSRHSASTCWKRPSNESRVQVSANRR